MSDEVISGNSLYKPHIQGQNGSPDNREKGPSGLAQISYANQSGLMITASNVVFPVFCFLTSKLRYDSNQSDAFYILVPIKLKKRKILCNI